MQQKMSSSAHSSRTHSPLRVIIAAALALVTAAACGSTVNSETSQTAGSGQPPAPATGKSQGSNTGSTTASGAKDAANYEGEVTYWFWGESDIPGIDKWMNDMVAKYQNLHPKVKINIVPQSSDTLIGAFNLAAQSKSGPDVDTQWATLPTLTPYWNGNVTPISDLVPASETKHWLNTSENTVGGKIVAMPLYIMGIPLVWNKTLFKQAGLDPTKPPTTWDELLADCAALKSHGITPIAMGNKDGFFGAWMLSIFGKQALGSLNDWKTAVAGTSKFSDTSAGKMVKDLYAAIDTLVKKGYLNSDISSLTLTQGWQIFPQGKAAMSFTTDGNVQAWGKALGKENVGVAYPPQWGNGALADTYDVTQSSDEFIASWSKNQETAATFLAWLHDPDNMKALYTQTGAFPADDRFPVDAISDPLAQQLFKLDTGKQSNWLENYIPTMVDTNADIPAGQMVVSGSGNPDAALALWDNVINQWRQQQPAEYQQFQDWAKG